MRLKGKVAIVTGGSQGIGEAIAFRYAAEGARVAVVYHANDAVAQAVVGRIAAAGGEAKPVKADCSKVAEIERMTAEVIQHFGTVDILVNNAGVFRTIPVAETTEAVWDEQLDLNLRGPGNEAYINLMRTMTPTGRDFLSVEEMTGAAVFLASDDASAIHGATLMVDAGWSAI
jgi:NAD(P)-dependent dehydrogenase (short-subunit alcohol dehydrogenase family)